MRCAKLTAIVRPSAPLFARRRRIGSSLQFQFGKNASEVMREGLRLVENREVEEATKLAALRAAAQLGVSALDRGEFKEFADASSLVAHLNKIGDEAISGAGDT